MTEDDFRTYIAAFNARDFAGFSRFYAPDVEFNLGDRKRIVGAQGIVAFYTGVFEHSADDLEVLAHIVSPDSAALPSRTKFPTIKDRHDFRLLPHATQALAPSDITSLS